MKHDYPATKTFYCRHSSLGESCHMCSFENGRDVGREESLRMREELLETLRWVRQTVHQAHHADAIEGCKKNTCDAITQAIAKAEGK